MNVFGFSPLNDRLILVECKACNRVLKASSFSHHLGKKKISKKKKNNNNNNNKK